jgi:hypothetical protein
LFERPLRQDLTDTGMDVGGAVASIAITVHEFGLSIPNLSLLATCGDHDTKYGRTDEVTVRDRIESMDDQRRR